VLEKLFGPENYSVLPVLDLAGPSETSMIKIVTKLSYVDLQERTEMFDKKNLEESDLDVKTDPRTVNIYLCDDPAFLFDIGPRATATADTTTVAVTPPGLYVDNRSLAFWLESEHISPPDQYKKLWRRLYILWSQSHKYNLEMNSVPGELNLVDYFCLLRDAPYVVQMDDSSLLVTDSDESTTDDDGNDGNDGNVENENQNE